MTAVRDGNAHLAALDAEREVCLDGELISRVAEHPAFANFCLSAAALYDFQAYPDNIECMTFDTNQVTAQTAPGNCLATTTSWWQKGWR